MASKELLGMRANLQQIKDFTLAGISRNDLVDVLPETGKGPFENVRLEDLATLYRCAQENEHLIAAMQDAYYCCPLIEIPGTVPEWVKCIDDNNIHGINYSLVIPYLLWILDGGQNDNPG